MNFVEIKSEAKDYVEIEGYGILFDPPGSTKRDKRGDYFTRDTDLALDKVSVRDVFCDHTYEFIPYPIGESKEYIVDDRGVKFNCRLFRGERLQEAVKSFAELMGYPQDWIVRQIAVAESYVSDALNSIKSGIMGFSTGSVNHLVRRVNGWVKRWPIYEISLSKAVCEPRLLGEIEIKSLAVLRPDLDITSTIVQDGELAYEISSEPSIKAGGSAWKRLTSIFVRDKSSPGENEMTLDEMKNALTEALKPVSDALVAVNTKLGDMDVAVKSMKEKEATTVSPGADALEAIKTDNANLKNDLAAVKSSLDALTKKPDASLQGAPVTPTAIIKSPFSSCVKEQ